MVGRVASKPKEWICAATEWYPDFHIYIYFLSTVFSIEGTKKAKEGGFNECEMSTFVEPRPHTHANGAFICKPQTQQIIDVE